MGELDTWQAMGVALAIGLLVGAERERSKPGSASPGIRSMALIALVGALTTVLPLVVAVAMVAAVVLLLVVNHWAEHEDASGTTSEVAAVVVLGLGALAATRPSLAVALAVTMTVLLVSRPAVHRFVQETVTERERIDALKFFVAAFVVLPLLPDRAVGPYGVWVPQRIWLLVVLITAIGWVGYAATRAVGARRGLMITGLAGGFVSATATTGVMASKVRQEMATLRSGLAATVLASVSTLVQLALFTAAVAPDVTRGLALSLVLGGAVLLAEAAWLARTPRGGAASHVDVAPADPEGRPFALVPALLLAGVITLVLPLAAWLEDWYGAAGSLVATAAGSLADVHGASVAMATLAGNGQVSTGVAVAAIAVGLATNTFSKIVVAAVAGGVRFAAWFALLMVPVAVAVAAPLLARL